MTSKKKHSSTLEIELTAEQRGQVAPTTAKDRPALKLIIQELEERIAPFCDGSVRF